MNTVPHWTIVTQADAFAIVAESLEARLLSKPDLCWPYAVNYALAIELYLKAYLAKPKLTEIGTSGIHFGALTVPPAEQIHQFSRLYDALNQTIREHLDSEFTSDRLSDRISSLREALVSVDEVFVRARYAFEGKAIPSEITRLRDIAKMLRTVIKSMPEIHLGYSS